MADGNKGSEDKGPSYWLDACEEANDIIPCEFIGDFSGIDQSFFGGIDHIVDSIKNGEGLPCNNTALQSDGMEITPSKELQENENCGDGDVQSLKINDKKMDDVVNVNSTINVNNNCSNGNLYLNGDDGSKGLIHDGGMYNGNLNFLSVGEVNKGDRDRDNEERMGKRVRLSDSGRYERGYSSRLQSSGSVQESNGRKRHREDEETQNQERSRDRDRYGGGRRREYYNGRREGRDREWRDREGKGYWEREQPGSKEIVYRIGSYEAARNRDVNKMDSEKNQGCNVKVEKNDESNKEKNLEDEARQYQLEVLEQAMQKNTIAFLETGAGKTLIAVLLIKGICNRLQQQNKKGLAVFLVPKVPLVYQQAEVIRAQTGYNVGHYCGEMGQDFWDTRRWQRDFDTKQTRRKRNV